MIHDFHADLRGNGSLSRIISLKKPGLCDANVEKPSDELRVYDEIDGTLIRSMSYRPSGCQGRLSSFEGKDLFGTGHDELVGFLNQSSMRMPMIVYWRDDKRKYQLSPLIMAPPQIPLPSDGSPMVERERALRTYLEPVVLSSGLPPAYGVADFSVTSGDYEDPPHIAGLYRIRTTKERWNSGGHEFYERTAWSLQQIGAEILSNWCLIPSEKLVIKATRQMPEQRIVARFAAHVQDFVGSCGEISPRT